MIWEVGGKTRWLPASIIVLKPLYFKHILGYANTGKKFSIAFMTEITSSKNYNVGKDKKNSFY